MQDRDTEGGERAGEAPDRDLLILEISAGRRLRGQLPSSGRRSSVTCSVCIS
ncbi:MAG: hypothetical protein AVDCRST_MAG12-3296 [uncultured Rubrobacteraceae bacterium]|uniref:Uncharacterized protein n=1 Tax=uncultured Rubrobacteraceae bacterium TaxID=349277 RepID=A0A6J4T3F9_9ACTN|nr:MAG: hypothetical protein AVDCRST_MAG12-3296 [uncultured Rubrobacteraceae bacterium]